MSADQPGPRAGRARAELPPTSAELHRQRWLVLESVDLAGDTALASCRVIGAPLLRECAARHAGRCRIHAALRLRSFDAADGRASGLSHGGAGDAGRVGRTCRGVATLSCSPTGLMGSPTGGSILRALLGMPDQSRGAVALTRRSEG